MEERRSYYGKREGECRESIRRWSEKVRISNDEQSGFIRSLSPLLSRFGQPHSAAIDPNKGEGEKEEKRKERERKKKGRSRGGANDQKGSISVMPTRSCLFYILPGVQPAQPFKAAEAKGEREKKKRGRGKKGNVSRARGGVASIFLGG